MKLKLNALKYNECKRLKYRCGVFRTFIYCRTKDIHLWTKNVCLSYIVCCLVYIWYIICVYFHQAEDNFNDFSLWINSSATICKTKSFQQFINLILNWNTYILFTAFSKSQCMKPGNTRWSDEIIIAIFYRELNPNSRVEMFSRFVFLAEKYFEDSVVEVSHFTNFLLLKFLNLFW